MKLKELIEKYEEYENGLFDFGAKIACQNFLKDLQQLDEPEKVKVPQCVHKYIQEAKEYNWDLQDLMKSIDDEDSEDLQRWFYHECNQETLARAWLDGYDVEEEKRYTVVVKETKQPLYYNAMDKKLFFSMGGLATKFTRKQLEEAGLGWAFDCEGIEVEEVE
jgi:hypothetical protein